MDKCGICLQPVEQLFETNKDGVFACYKCQPLVPEVSMEVGQQEHVSQDSSSLTCIICHKVLQTHKQMQVHLRNHNAERRFVCTYCSKAFTQSNNLRAHLRIHTNERPYKCHVCEKAFTQVTNLNNHVRLHTGERPFVCHEPGCDKAYAQVSTLNQHRKRHLEGSLEGRVACTVCERSFDTAQRMAAHRTKVHGKVHTIQGGDHDELGPPASFECKICGAACGSAARLERHVAAHVAAAPRAAGAPDAPTSFKCVFSTCGALLGSPRDHTEHLLRAHQLRVSSRGGRGGAQGEAGEMAAVRPRGRPRRAPPPQTEPEKRDPLESDQGFSYEVQVEQLKQENTQYLPKLRVQSLFQ